MGKVSKKKLNKLTKVEEYRISKYKEKIEEYSKYTLDELKTLYQNKETKPGGIYLQAMIEVVRRKQIEAANATITENTTPEINTTELETLIEETPVILPPEDNEEQNSENNN